MDSSWALAGFVLVIQVILTIAGYAMKSTQDTIKEQVRDNRQDIDHVKEKYFKKEDFTEFKQELWNRLDRFEADMKHQINKNG